MNDVLIHTIIEHTKVMFYNFSITLKTCDMDTILCDMPIWKHVYHTLHSLDQWYINPEVYTEPDFHEPNLNSLDDYDNKKVLSRELLIDYFESIQEKIMEYLSSLSDADLYEKPDGCAYNRLSLILGQFRHFHCHMGNINATTIYNTNQWPRVAGMYWLDKIDDCKDIKDLYE